jgi:hypothetical protein
MKKIILITFIIFFINNALAKVEKTTFGIDMDIPNDYVLIKKENYEQLKKIAEFSTSSQSNILKPIRENNRSDVDQLIASGTKDKSYLMIIPMPPEKFQTHMISFTNMGSDNPTLAILNEYKSNIKKLCDDWFKEIKSEPIYQNLKISECVVEKNKFKNTSEVLKIKFDTNFSTLIKNTIMYQYIFDVRNNGFMVMTICEKNCSKLDGALKHIVSSIK